MKISRRKLIGDIASFSIFGTISRLAQSQSRARRPDPSTFESGDFVWPKNPGAFVPYRSESKTSIESDRERWDKEKKDFLERARRGGIQIDEQVIDWIAALSYDEFRVRYMMDEDPHGVTPYSSGRGVSVGHVGVIELDEKKEPWIIEALLESGVTRSNYSTWIAKRESELVWHGQLKNTSLTKRMEIAAQAKAYVSKPYEFWNFDLADDSGFYCSKLVWLATMKATGIAIDGNLNSSRGFWLSPKQILYSSKIERRTDPGDYTYE